MKVTVHWALTKQFTKNLRVTISSPKLLLANCCKISFSIVVAMVITRTALLFPFGLPFGRPFGGLPSDAFAWPVGDGDGDGDSPEPGRGAF